MNAGQGESSSNSDSGRISLLCVRQRVSIRVRCCRPVQVRTTPDSVRETCQHAADMTTVAHGVFRRFVHSVDVTDSS